ncbi:MAG: hypothetical protein R3E42_07640 [Burkholderiaceae bacterium]
MPLTPMQRHLCASGWFALAVWLGAALFGPSLLALVGLEAWMASHPHLYSHGHPFVDARSWLGVPNALDVLSNLPLALAGLWGMALLAKRRRPMDLHKNTGQVLRVFFLGLMLTAAGSAVYHWSPSVLGLALDRLGMAVAFAGVLGLAMAERVGARIARNTLIAVLLVGGLSAVMPVVHGNVLPWAVVQFGGMAFLAWAAWRKPLPTALGVSLGSVLALYAMAKLFETGDAHVFRALNGLVSGHTLKHLAAAAAAWPVIRALRENAQSERVATHK